jgi:hypothetical protein
MARRQPTSNEKNYLLQEVGNICPSPRCKTPLTEVKNSKLFNRFQVAHIYPSSPTPKEDKLLKNEELLHEDIENIDNMIALCLPCHDEFDNPRTIKGYRAMCSVKLQLKKKADISREWSTVKLDKEIIDVIGKLSNLNDEQLASAGELNHKPKKVDDKVKGDKSVSLVLKNNIKQNVVTYYNVIKQQFEYLDKEIPYKSEEIFTQIRLINTKLKKQGLNKAQIYAELNNWIVNVTNTTDETVVDIIASFFVQNCEALE